jgi:hypothetical protein
MPILSADAGSETFPCPHCNAFIREDSMQCRYCSVVIPRVFPESAIKTQNKINKARDQAGWLLGFTGVMWVFFFLRWIPLIGLRGWIGLAITFFSAPVWLAYWWGRFSRIKTADVDFSTAKRNWIISFFLWILMIAVLCLLMILPLLRLLGAPPITSARSYALDYPLQQSVHNSDVGLTAQLV